jgi:hypothetical protein
MKIGKLDITNWRWEYAPGVWYKLRRPDEILRVLTFWPVVQLLRILFCLAVFAQWGRKDAYLMWENTQ